MRCDDYLKELSAYIDDELDQEVRKTMQTHQLQCDHCKTMYETYKLIQDEIGNSNQVQLPQTFHSQLMGKIQHEKQIKTSKRNKYLWAYTTAAAVMLVVLGVNQQGMNVNQQARMPVAPYQLIQEEKDDTALARATREESPPKEERFIETDGLVEQERHDVSRFNIAIEKTKWQVETQEDLEKLKQLLVQLENVQWQRIDDTVVELNFENHQAKNDVYQQFQQEVSLEQKDVQESLVVLLVVEAP